MGVVQAFTIAFDLLSKAVKFVATVVLTVCKVVYDLCARLFAVIKNFLVAVWDAIQNALSKCFGFFGAKGSGETVEFSNPSTSTTTHTTTTTTRRVEYVDA